MIFYDSCGAWLNGEYYTVSPQDYTENGPIIRRVEKFTLGCYVMKKVLVNIKLTFNLKSKIDGCSLKKVGHLPFDLSYDIKCVGVPSSKNSSDEILLLDVEDVLSEAVVYVDLILFAKKF